MGDGHSWIHESNLTKVDKQDKSIFYVTDYGYEEYYIVTKNGNLNVYDNLGYIATYKKV